jgi:Flp pilus assembly protein TadD
MSAPLPQPSTSRLALVIRWIVYLVLLLTPFLFTWVNEELFEFPKMLLVYGLVGIGLTLAVIDHAWRNDWHWPKSKFDWLIGSFVVSQVLSTVFSIHPRTSWLGYYTRFNGGLLSTLTFVGLYYLIIRYFSPRQLLRLSKVLVAVGVAAALYAFPEHFGHSPSCLLIAKTFSVDCWVQSVQFRVFGTFGQPNWLAAYLITLMPLALSWLIQARNWWSRGLYFLSWLIMMAVLLFTKSRSGLIGLGVGLGVWICLYVWHWFWQRQSSPIVQTLTGKKEPKNSPWKTVSLWVISLILVTGGLIGLVGTPFSPTATGPTSPVPSGTVLETGGTESGDIRKIVWLGAVRVWQRYPIFGSGVETFAYSYYQDRPMAHNLVSEWDFLYNKAHNELLNYLATTGLVGLLTYLSLWVGLSVLTILYLRKRVPTLGDTTVVTSQQLVTIAWVAGLSAQFVSNFFGFSTVMVNVLFWVGLASLAQWIKLPSAAAPVTSSPVSPPLPSRSGWHQWGTIVVTILISLAGSLFLLQISRWWVADRDYALSKALFQAGQYQKSLTTLESAINQSPNEALFWDQLANQYSLLAASLQATPQASTSGDVISEFAKTAVSASDYALTLNPRHLDFYKTRSRMFISLAQIDPKYLAQAQETLEAARLLSPTDPKLVYHLGLIQLARHDTSAGLASLQLATTMKPDYFAVWFDLGKAYEEASQSAKAQEVYQHIITKVDPGNAEVTARLKALKFSKNLP